MALLPNAISETPAHHDCRRLITTPLSGNHQRLSGDASRLATLHRTLKRPL
jgi:hypothetical protein